MNLVHETKLSVFTEVPENKELNILYSLNQQNTPEVGGLELINDLSKLIKMSAINFYVLEGNKIIG
ncbi:GNAT family acetyltransferase, partial [Gammaproteobacteria bacterium]|nr:GNAT family acetyltransferase [Gammaproteobacteria bacterium]